MSTRVAVVQASSVPFDTEATIAKAERLIAECGSAGAALAVFPEAFVGCYPKGSAFGAVVGSRDAAGRELYARYAAGAVEIDGPEVARLVAAVDAAAITVVMGVIERLGYTLYCTALTLVPGIGLANLHRKLMPTGTERLIWGFGDGSTMRVVDTPVGRVGSVICWENYMPALRQAMYAQGIDVYCAPTADDRPTWVASMTHVALEGRVHVLSACQAIRVDEYPEEYRLQLGLADDAHLMRGGSVIIAPDGRVLAGPVFDEETILYVEMDPQLKTRQHLDFDGVGHYSRPDVFHLSVDTTARPAVTFHEIAGGE